MAKLRQPEPVPSVLTVNTLARIAGRDAPMHALLANATEVLAASGVRILPASTDPLDDYALIDATLARMPEEEITPATLPPEKWPAPGLGYAGFSPEARSHFLRWLNEPVHQAPAAFQQLFLAHIECGLLDALTSGKSELLEQCVATLRSFEAWPDWRSNEQRSRTALLADILLGDGERLATWLAEGFLAPHLVGIALGRQALSNAPLTPAEVVNLGRLWGITDAKLDEGVVGLRLRSLSESLSCDPLVFALRRAAPQQVDVEVALVAQNGESAATFGATPWRCAHRDLRLTFAQPDLTPHLAPLIAEMLDDVPIATSTAAVAGAEAADADAQGWMLILEFGQSRSEYFEFALKQAQRLPGYSALVDEQRHVIHRVHIKKSEMRRFWQLWEYAMNWNETKVYVNGKELEKWKIYPYSQFLT